jgi:hypothetical protein
MLMRPPERHDTRVSSVSARARAEKAIVPQRATTHRKWLAACNHGRPMRITLTLALLAAAAAQAQERKTYLSIAAEGGFLLAYERINITNEYSPALLLDGHVNVGYRINPTLVVGGSAAFLLNPIGERIRVWVDGRPTDTKAGAGAGIFFGPALSVFLSERIVLENAVGLVGLGSPGLWGGFGTAFNEAIAFRFAGEGNWKYGFDIRFLLVAPTTGDTRMFGFMTSISAGFSIALQ